MTKAEGGARFLDEPRYVILEPWWEANLCKTGTGTAVHARSPLCMGVSSGNCPHFGALGITCKAQTHNASTSRNASALGHKSERQIQGFQR